MVNCKKSAHGSTMNGARTANTRMQVTRLYEQFQGETQKHLQFMNSPGRKLENSALGAGASA